MKPSHIIKQLRHKRLLLQNIHSAGIDGLFMLLLSIIIIALSLGITFLYYIYVVARTAVISPSCVKPDKWIMVLGLRLKHNKPVEDYILRMQRVITLYGKYPHCEIMALGGRTGNNDITEAEIARQYFIKSGIPQDKIMVEDASTHTLENMQFARELIQRDHDMPVALVSNRYHLARCQAIVSYMGLAHKLCAAEDSFNFNSKSIFPIIKEAFHLHWYKSGQWWAQLTKNKKMLARIQ